MPNGLWELLQAVGAMQFGIKFSVSRKQSRRDVPQHSKVLIEFKSKWFIASFFIFAADTPARFFSCEECCFCMIGLFAEVVVLQASGCRLQIGSVNVILDFL